MDRWTCVHEAAHAAVCLRLGGTVGIVSAVPSRSSAGWARYELPPTALPREHAAVLLSGYCAEHLAGSPQLPRWPAAFACLGEDGHAALAVAGNDRRWLAEVAAWTLPLVDRHRSRILELSAWLRAARWLTPVQVQSWWSAR